MTASRVLVRVVLTVSALFLGMTLPSTSSAQSCRDCSGDTWSAYHGAYGHTYGGLCDVTLGSPSCSRCSEGTNCSGGGFAYGYNTCAQSQCNLPETEHEQLVLAMNKSDARAIADKIGLYPKMLSVDKQTLEVLLTSCKGDAMQKWKVSADVADAIQIAVNASRRVTAIGQ